MSAKNLKPLERIAQDIPPTLLETAKQAALTGELITLENADTLDSITATKRLTAELQDAEQANVPAIKAKLRDLSGPAHEAEKQRVITAQWKQHEVLKRALIALIASAKPLVHGYRTEARADEKAHFDVYGLPHEATGVSRQFDAVLAELDHYENGLLAAPVTANPSFRHPLLTRLGVEVD